MNNKPAKMRPTIYLFLMFIVFGVVFAPGFAGANSNILFIMDASDSMNEKIGNELKITVAKRVLSDLLKELPSKAKVGLMAYGHTISRERASALSAGSKPHFLRTFFQSSLRIPIKSS